MAVRPLDTTFVNYIAGLFQGDVDIVSTCREAVIIIAPPRLVEAMDLLKHEQNLRMDYLSNITGVEYADFFEVVYHLYSLPFETALTVKTRLAKVNPAVPSMVSLWPAADYQEREIFDLLGICFTGHPKLARILLPEGFDGHPLRKDYRLPVRPV